MSVSIDRSSGRLSRRFPVGAKYVVEGYGGENGNLRVIARYVVLPGGRRINVPGDISRPAAPRVLARRRRSDSKQSEVKRESAGGGKKFGARRGTA